jgi:hypothetical protein
MVGLVDDSHSAFAEPAFEHVLTFEGKITR